MCPFQGPGKQNPIFIGGYDNQRPTDDPNDPNYWIGSGKSVLFDAAANSGSGGNIVDNDLIRISKQAALESSEECDCVATVTVDIEAKAAAFEYYPPTPLDVVFVLDVTSSMMSSASMKFVQAKRALINTINQLWAANRNTTVTIVPYGRDAFVPNPSPGSGFSYNYVGSLYTWRRSSNPPPPTNTNYIGQILGYRNQPFVSTTELTNFITQATPLEANVEQSLYNYYNYYKLTYNDIYDASGNPLPDTVLSAYIANVYNAQPSAYTSNQIVKVASNSPLTSVELSYSMNNDGYANNSILQNLVWAIPYSEDTNTEAGLLAAYNLFKTPGFAQSDDRFRRVVILITDGQANRSINSQYPVTYVQPGDTDATFFPDIPGEPWRYSVYLEQTLPQLAAEISLRSATNEEIVLASSRTQEIADRLKDALDGNAQLYALGIDIAAQSPGPYTRENVIELMKSWVTAPSYLREADSADPDAINTLLGVLVYDVLHLYAGCRLVLNDVINNVLFRYVPGSIQIHGVRDGLRLKSPGQLVITDPSDPDFTLYPKAPLLPDVSDSTVADGKIAVDFGIMPLGLLSADSLTTITLTYQVKTTAFANGYHLHTNTDNQTYVSIIEPNHLQSTLPIINYSASARQLFFHTPIVACTCPPFPGLSLLKLADRTNTAPLGTVNYSIQLTNTGTQTLTNIAVNDAKLGISYVIPILNPLESVVNTFPHIIPANTPPGPYLNTAVAAVDAIPDPLSSSAAVVIGPYPSLQITKVASKQSASPGETVIFTITATNNGNVDLVNVRVTDSLLGINTTIAIIQAGTTVTADFPYTIPADTPNNAVLNTVTNVADNLSPVTVATTVTIAPGTVPPPVPPPVITTADFTVSKTVDRPVVQGEETVYFTIRVQNTGNVNLTNFIIEDRKLNLHLHVDLFTANAIYTIRLPYATPDVETDIVIVNRVAAKADQVGPKDAEASVLILSHDEE
ncbi:hypothetical protein [Paenibacillus sp. NPDC058174]|uniref:DUF7507 domain-containing protein n=1 Tax=Paenibacillus sp. NPDC058174 TaxID=3346366 RepID=UPI0036DC4328